MIPLAALLLASFPFAIPMERLAPPFGAMRLAPLTRLDRLHMSGESLQDTRGHEVRLAGVSLARGAALPDAKMAPRLAAHLASLGLGIVRLRELGALAPDGLLTREGGIDAPMLDRLHAFVAALALEGVRSALVLDFPAAFPDPDLRFGSTRELWFREQILQHLRGKTPLGQEPGLAMIELWEEDAPLAREREAGHGACGSDAAVPVSSVELPALESWRATDLTVGSVADDGMREIEAYADDDGNARLSVAIPEGTGRLFLSFDVEAEDDRELTLAVAGAGQVPGGLFVHRSIREGSLEHVAIAFTQRGVAEPRLRLGFGAGEGALAIGTVTLVRRIGGNARAAKVRRCSEARTGAMIVDARRALAELAPAALVLASFAPRDGAQILRALASADLAGVVAAWEPATPDFEDGELVAFERSSGAPLDEAADLLPRAAATAIAAHPIVFLWTGAPVSNWQPEGALLALALAARQGYAITIFGDYATARGDLSASQPPAPAVWAGDPMRALLPILARAFASGAIPVAPRRSLALSRSDWWLADARAGIEPVDCTARFDSLRERVRIDPLLSISAAPVALAHGPVRLRNASIEIRASRMQAAAGDLATDGIALPALRAAVRGSSSVLIALLSLDDRALGHGAALLALVAPTVLRGATATWLGFDAMGTGPAEMRAIDTRIAIAPRAKRVIPLGPGGAAGLAQRSIHHVSTAAARTPLFEVRW